ncbi:sterol desaturase family protein [Aquibaculum sediminis]|uniref:sterol desaturase family protein n=1 Tax=Aquibaculum sediminis TaxID=3231907 RepID=UPI0034572AA8
MDIGIATLLAWKGVIVGAWFLAFFLAERLRPAAAPLTQQEHEPRGGTPRLGRNAGLWLLNTGLSPLLVVPITAWAASQSLDWRPAVWSGWGGLLLDLLLLDLLIYWWHRANHEIAFLWRFHEVHHRDRFLDVTSAVRFHFGEVILSALARAAVIWLLGFPLLSVLVFEAVLLLASVFHHSNLRLPRGLERPLSKVIITPERHWVHHHAIRQDTDSNYGTVFVIWDRLFRSLNPNPRRLDMVIGVEGRGEQTLLALLLQPFRRNSDVNSSDRNRAPGSPADSAH